VVIIKDHEVAFRDFVVVGTGVSYVCESFWGYERDVSVVLFSLVDTGWSRQCVCRNVCVPWDVFDLIVVFLEVSVPSCGASIEVLRRLPVLEVGVVGDDCKWFFCPA
jgi:hypothetical protein